MRLFITLPALLVTVFVFFHGVSCAADVRSPNLVQNPGFELHKAGSPEAWKAYGDKGCCTRVSGETHAGNGALLISSVSDATPAWESEFIPLSRSGMLELSAWMKMENVPLGAQLWHKAGIRVRFFDARQQALKITDLVRDEGTHEWTQYQKNIDVPTGAAFAKVACYFSNTKGKAWFDDISLRFLPEHIGARFSHEEGAQQLTLTVDPQKKLGKIGNVNGLFYENAKASFKGVKELRPTLIRTPQIVTYYYLINDAGGGKIKYNWALLDRDLKAIVNMGAVPFLSIGWVPEAFEEEIKNRDYTRWNAFISELVARYSKKYDVSGWYWNLWNEPSVFRDRGGKKNYVNWYGTEDDFYQFYAQTVDAAVAANKGIKIGAAGFASDSPWLLRFIEWCGVNRERLDFVSWHSYAAVPQAIGDKVKRVRAALDKYAVTRGAEQVIDEWNGSSEEVAGSDVELGRGAYAAAYRISAISEMMNSELVANTWFSTYQKNSGVLAEGVKQPTYDSFVLLSELGSELVPVSGYAEDPYVSALAAVDGNGSIGVLVAHFKHQSDHSGASGKRLKILVPWPYGDKANYRVYRIDNQRSKGQSGKGVQNTEMLSTVLEGDHLQIDVTAESNSVLLVKIYK